jgi:hypothetical protein
MYELAVKSNETPTTPITLSKSGFRQYIMDDKTNQITNADLFTLHQDMN